MNPIPEQTDRQFLSYVRIHSQTERALFSHTDVRRFAVLANFPQDAIDRVSDGFHPLHFSDIKDHLEQAEQNLEQNENRKRLELALHNTVTGTNGTGLLAFLSGLIVVETTHPDGEFEFQLNGSVACAITANHEWYDKTLIERRTPRNALRGYHVWREVSYLGNRYEPPGSDIFTIAEETNADRAMTKAYQFLVELYFLLREESRVGL